MRNTSTSSTRICSTVTVSCSTRKRDSISATANTSFPSISRPTARKISGPVATDGCWPDWPRCCRICLKTISDSRSSCISSHAWPVQWQNANNQKATGPAPCSMQNMRRDLRLAVRLSSATACCGVSITDAWTKKSLPLSSSGHGNTSRKPPCSRAAR